MEEEKPKKIYYKLEAGKKYRVFKTTFDNGSGAKDFYRIQITQKMYDETVLKWYKQVTFKRGVSLDNETDIIINCAYENLRENKNDKYEPISYLLITDFDIVERQEQIEAQAYADFQQNLNEVELEISDEDLPF